MLDFLETSTKIRSMIPWKHIDTAKLPGKDGSLHLHQRGEEFALRLDRYELMNSRAFGSEVALADLACERLADKERARVLIGGLGMGFTLGAALAHLGPEGRAEVAELVPEVVAWNEGPLSHLAGHPLRDPRTEVYQGDVADLLRKKARYDAIMMDVDNGPDALTCAQNHWLYTSSGLRSTYEALRPKGILAVWSERADPAFTKKLRRAAFEVHEETARARGKKGWRHHVWIAVRG